MTLKEIVDTLNLTVLTQAQDLSRVTPTTGYTADLLSCVMAGAPRQGLWVTLQAHLNIVAVAGLLDLAAVIITEGAMPDSDTIVRAKEEGVTLLSTPQSTFYVVGRLWELGVKSET